MTLDHQLPPLPPFRTGKWLLGIITTTAIVGGIFGALTILFIPEGVFNFGPDNAIRGRGLKSVDERVIRLEEKIANVQPSSGTDVRALQANVDNAVSETRELKQKVADIQTGDQGQSRMATIIVGLTQLKTAYDGDQPMTDGVNTLVKAFPQGPVTETLNSLSSLVGSENFASKSALLDQLQQMRKPPETPFAASADQNLTWRERATSAIGQFVKVQPTQAIEQGDMLGQIQQAVSLNNFSAAAHMLDRLPQTADTKMLQARISTRAEVQDLVQKATSQVSQALGQSQGDLY